MDLYIYILILAVIILGKVVFEKREKRRADALKETMAKEAAAREAKRKGQEASQWKSDTDRREDICYGCKYWNADEHDLMDGPESTSDQECRRYPPQNGSNGERTWPETSAFDWCGEWSPLPDEGAPT